MTIACSYSVSSLFIEVLDVLKCSAILSGAIKGLSPSSNDETLLFSRNDEDDDDAPVNLSKWSSSDDKSKLLAKGTELESDATDVVEMSS